jgi:hypothetical protein
LESHRTKETVKSSRKAYQSKNSKEDYNSKSQTRQNYVLHENESFAVIPNQLSEFNDLAGTPIP